MKDKDKNLTTLNPNIRRRSHSWLAPLILTLAMMLAGGSWCMAADSKECKDSTRDIGNHLEEAAKFVECYGSIHMAAPLLTRPGSDFEDDPRSRPITYLGGCSTQVPPTGWSFDLSRTTPKTTSLGIAGVNQPPRITYVLCYSGGGVVLITICENCGR